MYECMHVCMYYVCMRLCTQIGALIGALCAVVGGNMARFTQFPLMITRSTIIYEIISPGATGSSIYV